MASTNPYFVTMAGLHAQCYCHNCQKLESIFADEKYQVDVTLLKLTCEHCKNPISVWTPDMGCPKCKGDMILGKDTLL